MVQRGVDQASLRAVGSRLLVLGTQSSRANTLGVVVLVSGSGSQLVRNTGLHVNIGCPVNERVNLLCSNQSTVVCVPGVSEAVTIMVPSVGLATLVEQDHFVDAVIVPLVVRGHLHAPLSNAGVQVTCEHGHGPLVVARTHVRVPYGRVTGTVVNQVGAGVIRPPAPYGATAVLPAVLDSLRLQPGLDAQILLTNLQLVVRDLLEGTALLVAAVHVFVNRQCGVLRIFLVEVSADQNFAIRASGICLPCQGAVLQVVRSDEAANAEFSTGATGQDLVLDHVRSVGVSSANLRVGVLNGPNNLTVSCVQSNQGTVVLLQQDLAVAEAQTARHVVAAQHCLHGRILFREVGPLDLLVVVQVQCVHVVRERSVNVHHAVDHQRGTFVTAVHTGSERPSSLQVLDVALVNLGQLGIALVIMLATRMCPVICILHCGFLISSSECSHRQSDGSTSNQTQSHLDFAHLHVQSP